MTFSISQEEAEKRLTENDKRTVTERAKRLVTLGGITISLVGRMVPNLMSAYHGEARDSFVNGSFRSCIFNCSVALDQIIRHELIAGDSNPVEKVLELESKKNTLGHMINKISKEIPSLVHLESKFRWMNEARNTISVHPICIIDSQIDSDIVNRQKADYIKKIIELLDEPERKRTLTQKITFQGRTIILKDVLENPKTEDADMYLMWDEHNRLVEPVALKANRTLNAVLTELYPAEM